MKKLTLNPRLAGLLPIVLLGAFVVWQSQKSSRSVVAKNFFDSGINQFCLDSVCVRSKDNNWLVEADGKTYLADKDLAENYARKIGEVQLTMPVSENMEKFKEFGFGGSEVKLSAGEKELLLGRISDNFDGVYVMEEGGDKVYLSKITLNGSSMKEADYWKRKYVTNLPLYQIKKVVVKKGQKSKEMVKKDEKWENEALVEKAAHLQSVKQLEDFEANTADTVMEIETEQEKVLLMTGKKQGERRSFTYWATTDNKYYFEINKKDYDLLTEKIF